MPACRLATALLAVCCNFCLQSSTIAAKCNKLYDDQLCFNYAQQMDHHHDSKVGTWLPACGRLFIIDQILAASQGFMSTLCRGHRTHDSSLDVCCCHPYREPGDSAYFREPFNLDATCFAQKCCTLGNREPACRYSHHVPCLSFHDRLDLRFSQGYTGLQSLVKCLDHRIMMVHVSLIDWISDTLSHGYTNLHSLVSCLDHRGIASDAVKQGCFRLHNAWEMHLGGCI